MELKTIISQIVTPVLIAFITTSTLILTHREAASETKMTFTCGTYRGVPATMVKRPEFPIREPIIYWASNWGSEGNSREQRCRDVSERFQRFYDLGVLHYIKHGIAQTGEQVICVSHQKDSPCFDTLWTLSGDVDPDDVLEQIFGTNNVRPLDPLKQGSGVYVDVEKLLSNSNSNN